MDKMAKCKYSLSELTTQVTDVILKEVTPRYKKYNQHYHESWMQVPIECRRLLIQFTIV